MIIYMKIDIFDFDEFIKINGLNKDILATLEQVYNDFTNGKLKTFSLEKSYSPQTIFQQYDEII